MLLPTSHAVDIGGSQFTGVPGTDLFGTVRPQDGDNDGATEVDMGAYELDRLKHVATVSSDRVSSFLKESLPPPDVSEITLRNAGLTSFGWTLREELPWLEAVPGTSLSGSLESGEAAVIALQVSFPAADEEGHGDHRGVIEIIETSTNGQLASIAATLSVPRHMRVDWRRESDASIDAEFFRIQDALNKAIDGDTITVAPGTYKGEGNFNLDMRGREVHLRSEMGPLVTVIDCDADGDGAD